MIDIYESILGSIGEATMYYFYDMSDVMHNFRELNKDPRKLVTFELTYDTLQI